MPYGQARRLPALGGPSTDRINLCLRTIPDGPGFLTCLFSALAPVAANAHPRVAATHPGPTGAIWRRKDVVRIVGDVALTVDYYLTGLASYGSRLGDGGGCADHCGYRKPCANRRQE